MKAIIIAVALLIAGAAIVYLLSKEGKTSQPAAPEPQEVDYWGLSKAAEKLFK